MSMRTTRAAMLSWILAITASAVGAGATESVLGNDGTVYRLLSGRYDALFESGSEAAGDSAVLALDIVNPEGAFERLLVPETASRSAEQAQQLVYEQSTDTLFVLWEGILNDLHPLLYLGRYQDRAWGEVLEISGDPFARKGQPQLHVTHDRVRADEPEADAQLRTTLHVVWWEGTAGGSRKRYAPITIEGQSSRSWHPTWDLSSFATTVEDAPVHEYTELVRLSAGAEHNTVTIGFLTTAGDRVVTLDSEVVPSALAGLGDAIRIQFINDGLRFDSVDELAAAIEAFILANGGDFHPATLAFLADRVAGTIRDERLPLHSAGVTEIADTIRVQFINDGLRIASHGLAEDEDFELIEIERLDEPGTFQVLKVTVLSERPVPEGLVGPADLFLSVDGRHAILAWQVGNEVRYVESIVDGWGPERSLVLDEGFSFDDARRMLGGLAHGR